MSLYTIKDMLEKFGIDQKTLYNWRHTENLPYIKIGKTVYFREEAVNQWLLEKETKAKA